VTTAPLPPLVPDGYALARLMATNRRAAVKAVQRASDRYIDNFLRQLDVMEKAMGIVRNPDPQARLAAYLLKPDEVWAAQRREFPKDYAEDWQDFQKLRERANAGEWAGAADEAERIVRDAQRTFR
jgi:hypothetical protein